MRRVLVFVCLTSFFSKGECLSLSLTTSHSYVLHGFFVNLVLVQAGKVSFEAKENKNDFL